MSFVEALGDALPAAAVVTDPDIVESYRHDRTNWVAAGMPSAVVLPNSTRQVAIAVELAARHNVPVLARGAGSSLVGGATATDGCLVVCLERMNRIRELDAADRLAIVEPGVINVAVSAAAREHGLFYPPDPASRDYATIGGNVATNAGGLCCVKYGVTRDHVLGLEVVLADGRIIDTGRRTIKGVAGLDLTALFVGSEGTLGIVTSATLRLTPAPDGAATAVATFPTLGTAGQAVAAIMAAGLPMSLVEIMDHGSIVAVQAVRDVGIDQDAAAVLFLQSDEPEPRRSEAAAEAARLCQTAGASWAGFTSDTAEAEMLLEARRMVSSAVDALGQWTLHEDVAVPVSKVPELIGRIEELSDRHGVRAVTFGHAGDGNLHPALVVDDHPDGLSRALALFDAIADAALGLGGTVAGEHGIGRVKGGLLARELSSDNLDVQRRIKRALDPEGVFAPHSWL